MGPLRTQRLKLASYNIHSAVGRDGRRDPRRIVQVLTELAADVIALQEVATRAGESDMLGLLAREAGYAAIAGTILNNHKGDFGNAILTRQRALNVRHIDLSVGRREPRGAIDVELDSGAGPLRVVATHLGLGPGERRQQVRRLLEALDQDRAMPTVLLGDLNEWFLWGRPLRWLHAHFQPTPAPASFPAGLPVFALDRIWANPSGRLQAVTVHRSPLARVASDHLPVTAEFELPTR